MNFERLMDVAVRQARKHAKTVLSVQENRMAPDWGITSPLRRVQALARVLQGRIESATDKGVESAIFWHGKWLCHAAARTCLEVLQARAHELAPAGAAA